MKFRETLGWTLIATGVTTFGVMLRSSTVLANSQSETNDQTIFLIGTLIGFVIAFFGAVLAAHFDAPIQRKMG